MDDYQKLFQELRDAARETEGYSYALDMQGRIAVRAAIDRRNDRQHIELSYDEKPSGAEVFWEQAEGYGRKLSSTEWHRLSGPPFPDMLEQVIALLEIAEAPEITETEGGLLVGWTVGRIPLAEDPVAFFDGFFGERTERNERFLAKVQGVLDEMTFRVNLGVDHAAQRVRYARVETLEGDQCHEMFVGFDYAAPDLPGLPEAALALVEPELPAFMLLFDYPKWGWVQTANHGPWAQASLDLVAKMDTDKEYITVTDKTWSSASYDVKTATAKGGTDPIPGKHHPVVLGAVFEDLGTLPANPYTTWFTDDADYKKNPSHYAKQPYQRDFHHYGGGDKGVQKRWYFIFRELDSGASIPSPTKPDDRYYSARDWGFGGKRIDPTLNRLTFTEAIRQYNQNAFEGRRRAYLMLGHAVHLLQDQGQPDHVRLVDHGGSSKSEDEIFDYVCPILAAEAALAAGLACGPFGLFCAAGAFATVMGICMALVDSDEVGYEKLIALNPPKTGSPGIIEYGDYDTFFAEMAKFSDGATTMSSALGCGSLFVPPLPPVPHINPDIDSKDASETKPYLDLTDKLLPQIIGQGAGLIRHFHKIVNPPPFVQRLAIVQWQAGDKPREFALFDKTKKDQCLRYDAAWQPSGKGRVLKVAKQSKVSTDRRIYFFVQFGPAQVAPDTGRRMRKTSLRVTGTDIFTGKAVNDEVILSEDYDPKVGVYYWGSYLPRNCANDPITMTVEISAKDGGAHLGTRTSPGDDLDAHPSAIPYVDHTASPTFPWKDYTPGIDTQHEFTIGKLEWNGFSAQPPTSPIGREGFIDLKVNQWRRNCTWEKKPGPVTCPVEWKIETTLKDVTLSRGRIRIRPNRELCPAGTYQIKITCTLGALKQTKIVSVTIL